MNSKVRQDVMRHIRKDREMQEYLRMKPIWYRKLGRSPQLLSEFELECKQFFHKTIPDRVNQLSTGIQMAQIMMSMFKSNA